MEYYYTSTRKTNQETVSNVGNTGTGGTLMDCLLLSVWIGIMLLKKYLVESIRVNYVHSLWASNPALSVHSREIRTR